MDFKIVLLLVVTGIGILNTIYLSYNALAGKDVACFFFPPEWCKKVQLLQLNIWSEESLPRIIHAAYYFDRDNILPERCSSFLADLFTDNIRIVVFCLFLLHSALCSEGLLHMVCAVSIGVCGIVHYFIADIDPLIV